METANPGFTNTDHMCEFNKEIGCTLTRLRRDMNMNRKQFVDHCSISLKTLQRLEDDPANSPSLSTLYCISVATGVPVSEIIMRAEINLSAEHPDFAKTAERLMRYADFMQDRPMYVAPQASFILLRLHFLIVNLIKTRSIDEIGNDDLRLVKDFFKKFLTDI